MAKQKMHRAETTVTHQFQIDRSHKASEIAYDFAKFISQVCLLINGGAATAVIAFLAKEKVDPLVYRTVPWCLFGYTLGVAASAVMAFSEMMNADGWNYFWYYLAYEDDESAARAEEEAANKWHKWGFYGLFIIAIACFLAASTGLAIAFLYATSAALLCPSV